GEFDIEPRVEHVACPCRRPLVRRDDPGGELLLENLLPVFVDDFVDRFRSVGLAHQVNRSPIPTEVFAQLSFGFVAASTADGGTSRRTRPCRGRVPASL